MPKSVSGFTGLLDIPTDYQAHHRLPQQLADNPFLKQLNGIVDLKDFGTNGIALPKDVATGLTTGQTPHLGSHPAYTDFIEGLLDTATSKYDPSVPLTPSQLDEFDGRVNAIQAYSRMALSGLLPDSNVTPGGRVPLNSRDPMISSGDPAEVRAFYDQLGGDLQSKGFTTPESLDRLVDFPRYELLNQANAFDPNLTATQRNDLVRNVDDVRASLDASGRTDLTSGLDDAARGRYTLNGSAQPAAPTGASPELLQGVESATGRSFATGLMAPESLETIDRPTLRRCNPLHRATRRRCRRSSSLRCCRSPRCRLIRLPSSRTIPSSRTTRRRRRIQPWNCWRRVPPVSRTCRSLVRRCPTPPRLRSFRRLRRQRAKARPSPTCRRLRRPSFRPKSMAPRPDGSHRISSA